MLAYRCLLFRHSDFLMKQPLLKSKQCIRRIHTQTRIKITTPLPSYEHVKRGSRISNELISRPSIKWCVLIQFPMQAHILHSIYALPEWGSKVNGNVLRFLGKKYFTQQFKFVSHSFWDATAFFQRRKYTNSSFRLVDDKVRIYALSYMVRISPCSSQQIIWRLCILSFPFFVFILCLLDAFCPLQIPNVRILNHCISGDCLKLRITNQANERKCIHRGLFHWIFMRKK